MSEKAVAYVGLSFFAIYNIMVQWWWIDEGVMVGRAVGQVVKYIVEA